MPWARAISWGLGRRRPSAGGVARLEQAARKLGRRCPYGGRRCRWLDRIRRTCGSGSWRRWRRGRRPGGGGGGERGATPGAAARRFAVGRSTAHRWAREARVEGRRTAKRMGGGPKPRIAGEVEAALLGLPRGANHLTLAECRDRLAERTGVRVHPWTLDRPLRRCGWKRKKRSRHAAEQGRA